MQSLQSLTNQWLARDDRPMPKRAPDAEPSQDYLERFAASPLRAAYDAEGIRVWRAENGMIYQSCDPEEWARRGAAQRRSALPEAYRNRTFERFRLDVYPSAGRPAAEQALRCCRNFVERYAEMRRRYPGKGLYLYSRTCGSGKTFLASIMARELEARHHADVCVISLPELLNAVRQGFRSGDATPSGALRRCKAAEILFLDDFGAEKASDWVNETLFDLIDARQGRQLTTCFTANQLPEELSCDGRVVSRVEQMASVVRLPEESVRARMAAVNHQGMMAFLNDPPR